MINTCHPLHVADIIYYCPEEAKGICINCKTIYKNKGFTLHLISEIAKIQLSDIDFATQQANKLSSKIRSIYNQAINPEGAIKKLIMSAFDYYISTVNIVKDKVNALLNNRNPY